MTPGSYGSDEDADVGYGPSDVGDAPFGQRSFRPKAVMNPAAQLNQTVKALMRGYLRKQTPQPGGLPYPFTSSAPEGILQSFKALDKYSTFGVPYTGLPSGKTSYDALFSDY